MSNMLDNYSPFWTGIVEDNTSDPLNLGGCKVRIIGRHSTDTTKLPTKDLPTVRALLSINGQAFGVPKIGDFVSGHYLDGANKQHPVMHGIYPGLVNTATHVRLTSEAAAEAKVVANNQPQVITVVSPASTTANSVGLPSTAPSSRGIVVGTSLDYTNNLRRHACDISYYVNNFVHQAKLFTGRLIAVIRTAIVNVLKAFDISPGFSSLRSSLADLNSTLRSINKFLQDVVIAIADVAESIRRIRAVIEFILSLPERLIALFRDCLNKLYAILASAAFQIISDVQTGIAGEVSSFPTTELLETINQTQTVVKNAISIAAAPVTILNAAVSPSGMSPAEQENLAVNAFPGLSIFKTENFQGP